MATSKHHKDHKQKVNQFKEKIMQAQKESVTPKTHLVPQPEWQSTDILEMRGDYLEVIDQSLAMAYQALTRAGHAYQQVLAQNVEKGKVKINYVWNTGEPASEAEVADYKAQMERIQELRKKQLAEIEEGKDKPQQPGVLVDLNGAALTQESLDTPKLVDVDGKTIE